LPQIDHTRSIRPEAAQAINVELRMRSLSTLALLIALAGTAQAQATRSATCGDVDKNAESWDKLRAFLDKRLDQHGAFEIPAADERTIENTRARLMPTTLQVATSLQASSERRWQKIALYLLADLKLMREIDRKDGDDWDDESNAMWRIVTQLDRVSKLCEQSRTNRVGGGRRRR
jgi:hypothetical protein